MALKPIYGWSGNNPVLNHKDLQGGEMPVCMEVPNPHPPWSYNLVGSPNCTVSVTAGEVKIQSTVTGYDGFTGWLDLYLNYAGLATLNLALSTSRAAVRGSAYYLVFPGYESDTIYSDGGLTRSFPVPYYRYRIRIQIDGGAEDLTTGDWVKLAITFS